MSKNLSSKYKILKILRTATSAVSGEEIAELSNISRVAVWKAIQSLQSVGYKISSNRSGYILEQDLEDSLFPWEFGLEEQLYFHFPETESTMIEARKIAESLNSEKLQVITADKQTSGVGHAGHKWTTTKGSLAFTIITKNKIPVHKSQRILMASQIAIANVLKEITGNSFFVRWPNDVWSKNGKVCGVLDDFSATGSICNYLNIGVGINLQTKPKIANTDFVLHDEKKLSRKNILSLICKEFKIQQKIALEETSALETEWNKLCYDINKKVRLNSAKEEWTFKGINELGFAILSNNKTSKIIIPGTDSFIK